METGKPTLSAGKPTMSVGKPTMSVGRATLLVGKPTLMIRRSTIIRLLLSGLVLSGIAVWAYAYLYGRASDTVKSEVLKVVDDMFDAEENRSAMRRFIEAAHDDAFEQALDVKRQHGQKFDGPLYFRLVFDSVIASARAEGMTRMADTIEREREHFTFETTEE